MKQISYLHAKQLMGEFTNDFTLSASNKRSVYPVLIPNILKNKKKTMAETIEVETASYMVIKVVMLKVDIRNRYSKQNFNFHPLFCKLFRIQSRQRMC